MPEKLVTLRESLVNFVDARATQSQAHIQPLHWHIAERLVIEGGFSPDEIVPRPPLRAAQVGSGKTMTHRLLLDSDSAVSGELTILGGLKTKSVDVVVVKEGLGPCIAISVKGTLNAFRNLTNRMEEAAGDCTNIHISYPNLVYGFFHVIRATPESQTDKRNDAAIDAAGNVVDGIVRYHDAMSRLCGRQDVRDDVSRYEAVCLALVATQKKAKGTIIDSFPPRNSPIRVERFFEDIYRAYDLRYVYAAPALRKRTQRLVWAADSPAIQEREDVTYAPRVAT